MVHLDSLRTIRDLLRDCHVVAVVGLSPKEDRPSYRVARYLLQAGFAIVPVNPGQQEILGQRCFPDLRSIPGPVDLVDVFRRAEETPPIARDAVAIGARGLWLQQGIISAEAARIAREGGLAVVMDRCLMVEHQLALGQLAAVQGTGG